MYQDFFGELYRQDYLKGIKSFINFVFYNMKNISGDKISYLCTKCKNKKFHHKDVVTMYILKKKSLRNTYISLHTENPAFLMKP